MNIGNITSDNFNLDGNGKDIQIEVYEQLIEQLQQENKILKEKYENAVADYETTMFEKGQLNSLVNSCQEEIRQLKKQLEEYQLQNIDLRVDIMIQKKSFPNKLIKDKTFYDLYDMPTYEDLLNQQNEFIKYLEDLIKQNETVVEVSKYGLPKNCSKLLIDFYKEILSKYQEMIGGKK